MDVAIADSGERHHNEVHDVVEQDPSGRHVAVVETLALWDAMHGAIAVAVVAGESGAYMVLRMISSRMDCSKTWMMPAVTRISEKTVRKMV